MNAKEAREAIKFQQSDSLNKTLDTMAKSLIGEGYLVALEGLEVKALVDSLEKIKNVDQMKPDLGQIVGSEHYEAAWLECLEIANEALQEFQNTVGKAVKL